VQELANYLVMMQQLGERLAPGAYVAAARRAREGVRDMTMFLAVHMAGGLKYDVQRHPEVAEVFAQLTEKARAAPAALLAILQCYFSVCSVMQGAAAKLPQSPVVSGPCMRGGGRGRGESEACFCSRPPASLCCCLVWMPALPLPAMPPLLHATGESMCCRTTPSSGTTYIMLAAFNRRANRRRGGRPARCFMFRRAPSAHEALSPAGLDRGRSGRRRYCGPGS